ncbi:MAG: YraN family protein [Flavobacteriales bacterium]
MLALGLWGEEEAVKYLIAKGYTLLERNYRFKKVELDIILKKDNIIIAVEVKTRSESKVVTPFFSINKTKQRNLILGINHYVQRFKEPVEVRMDAVSVLIVGDKTHITHVKDAFPAF